MPIKKGNTKKKTSDLFKKDPLDIIAIILVILALGFLLFNQKPVFANTGLWKDKLTQYLSKFNKMIETQLANLFKQIEISPKNPKNFEVKTNIQITTVIKNTTPTPTTIPTTNSNNQTKTQKHYKKKQPTPTPLPLQNFKIEYDIKITPFKTNITLPPIPTLDPAFSEEFNKNYEEIRKRHQEIEKEQEEFLKNLCQEHPDAEICKEKNF